MSTSTDLPRQVRIPLPDGFDQTRHGEALAQQVSAKMGGTWQMVVVESAAKPPVVVFRETSTLDRVEDGDKRKRVYLRDGAKESEAQQYATRFANTYPDYVMTAFDTALGSAELTLMTEDERRFHKAVADVFGVKPWQIKSRSLRTGGFGFTLPQVPGKGYTPSKHDKKLDEMTEMIGEPGWYFKVDSSRGTGQVLPASLVTFEPGYSYPDFNRHDVRSGADDSTVFTYPIGVALGSPGVPNEPWDMSTDDSAGALIQGLAGSGKSVAMAAIVFGALARGHWLAVIDVPLKKEDYKWCKDLVHENWWGCESLADALVVTRMIYEIGDWRGQHLFPQYGVQKWQELPDQVKIENPPITFVVDELAALMVTDPVPKSLPKEHPVRVEAEQNKAEAELLRTYLTKIPAELRAAGIRLVAATQQAQSNFGIPPSLKVNLPNRMLLGPKANDAARRHAFAAPDAVPEIPTHVADDPKRGKGVGAAEFEGRAFRVIKPYFATVGAYRDAAIALGAPTTANPQPTDAQVSKYGLNLTEYDDLDDGGGGSRWDEGGFGEPDGRDAPEQRLRGAAAAAHASKVIADQAARAAD